MSWARLVASVGGLGFAPAAPGTVGSLAGLAIGGALLAASPVWLTLGVVAIVVAGWWSIKYAAPADDDPGWVVIDEVAGQCVAVLGLAAPTPFGLLAAFALFRVLDIAKPGPVAWADRRHGAAFVMADDLIAGGLAAALLLFGRLILRLS